ncbi:MAG: hypothetical protein EP346_12195 [Bacteroidetes bacterium]|nr:MAG: hypothetical protein EP346_12195 [Bacteroidota bacterium]
MNALFQRRWLLWVVGIGVGAIGGYLYYSQIGCESGSCAITSDPTNSTLYGSLMGVFLFDSFYRKDKSSSQNTDE